jgi:hypothetical protein
MSMNSVGGGKLYFFSGVGNKNLIITSHGGRKDTTFVMPTGSTIWFCGRHGLSTKTDADDIVNAFGPNPDLRLAVTLRERGLHAFFSPKGTMQDYDLSKFAGRHGGGDYENYETYDTMSQKGFDILSPRNRWFSKDVKLSYVLGLNSIAQKNYTNIYLSFCRS